MHTSSGTRACAASITAGWKFAAAVPDVQQHDRRPPAREPEPERTERGRALVEHDVHAEPVVARRAPARAASTASPGATTASVTPDARPLVDERRPRTRCSRRVPSSAPTHARECRRAPSARRARSRLHADRELVVGRAPTSCASRATCARSTCRAPSTFAATARRDRRRRRPRRSTSATRWAAGCACGSRSTGPTSCAALVLVSASPGIADAAERAARVEADEAARRQRRTRRRRRVPRAAGSRNRCSRPCPPDAPGLADRRRLTPEFLAACLRRARRRRDGTDVGRPARSSTMPVLLVTGTRDDEVHRDRARACSSACTPASRTCSSTAVTRCRSSSPPCSAA